MSNPVFYSSKANDAFSDNGPRTAAVLTFSGDSSDSIVKELTQNSLDARVDRRGNLKIKISFKEVPKTSIPNFGQFEDTLSQMEEYWNSKSNQYKRFFETAKKSIEGSSVKMFVFEDFMTKGLEGNDKEGTFKNCVNDENVSGKTHSDSLGNHGIGKNSVFGYSGVHTVFYSSLNADGAYKFKGVTKLGTYLDNENIKRSERTYYGKESEKGVTLVSKPEFIPEVFKRSETGLSQFVLGAELEEDWSDSIRRAFIENYWYLFEANKLTVHIDEEILNNDNYIEEAQRLFINNTSKENPIPFIKAYKEKEVFESKEIHKIGKVNLYLLEAKEEDIFPNKVVFLRDGMKIKMDNLNVGGLPTNIAGVMFCNTVRGNSILGAMEPHAHNSFLPELVAKKEIRDVTVGDAHQILKEINKFRREVLLKVKEKYTQETESVDIVDELFSKILGLGSGTSSGKITETKDETFYKKTVKIDFDSWFRSNKRNSTLNNNEETDLGEGEGTGVGRGTGGTGERKGEGTKKGEGGGSSKSEKKIPGKIKHNITSRFFISQEMENENKYNLVLRANDDIPSMDLIIGQKGDSERTKQMSADIIKAESNGIPLEFSKILNKDSEIVSFRINGVNIKEDKPEVIEITLKEKKKSALKIIETV